MRILHTSDWHLGRTIHGKARYDEFEAFLNWLADTIEQNEINALIMAGDVFDTSSPSNRAQELYYRFVNRVSKSSCRHAVFIAGNHDSPSFLSAPQELLKVLNIHVVGSLSANPADEVLVLQNTNGQAEMIGCAVPYLRDRDIRTSQAGESIDDKSRKLIQGIRDHYASVGAIATQWRNQLQQPVPIVVMGHLFTVGGKTIEGDGVRELYVGSLAHAPADIFPTCADYVALGHLHSPQTVGGCENIRYCGSPIPLGFGEAKQQKVVCQVDFDGPSIKKIQLIDVPLFQPLERIAGDWPTIATRLEQLRADSSTAWLEILYAGRDSASDLRERLDLAIQNTRIEILRITNTNLVASGLTRTHDQEILEELSVDEVFARCLDAHDVPSEQRPGLFFAYRDIVNSIDEDDHQAE